MPEFKLADIINQRLSASEDLVKGILHGKINESAISALYPENLKTELRDELRRVINNFISTEIKPILDAGKSVRPIDSYLTSEVRTKKNSFASFENFKAIDVALSNWQMPEIKYFQEMFGDYANFAYKNFNEFNRLAFPRKCGLPYTKHLLRNAMMAKEIGFDKKSGKPNNYYTTLWALHDSVEDLVYSIETEKGDVKYGLVGIQKFLNDYIPQEMHEDILMVTNKSDLILKYLKKKRYSTNNQNGIIRSLKKIQGDKNYLYFHKDIENMLKVIEDNNVPKGESYFEGAKWMFYDKIFLKNLAEQAYEKDHVALFEGKGVCDLYDNFVGRESGSLVERRKSIMKLALWAFRAEEIVERGKRNGRDYSFFENKIVELMNESLTGAIKLEFTYISQDTAYKDHLISGLDSVKYFIPIHYMNNKPSNLHAL